MKHNRSSIFVYNVLMYSRAAVPIFALLAAMASSVRTIQTAAEIYTASGTSPIIVVIVAFIFTITIEGMIFVAALSRERQRIEWRQAKKRRHVTTVTTVWRSFLVRIGRVEPLSYDQMPESETLLTFGVFLAFSAALVANVFIGTRPLIEETRSSTVQAFIGNILNASADVQTRFVADMFFALFPPIMTLLAGHLTAKYASKVYASMSRSTPEHKSETKPSVEPRLTKSESRSKPARLNASARVIEHLNAHPEDLNLSQRQLAKKLEVSVGTVNEVFKRRLPSLESEQIDVSPNGRHE